MKRNIIILESFRKAPESPLAKAAGWLRRRVLGLGVGAALAFFICLCLSLETACIILGAVSLACVLYDDKK